MVTAKVVLYPWACEGSGLMVQSKSRASNMVHTPIQHCYVHDGSTVSIYSITKLYMYKPCSNSPLLWLVPRVNWLGYLRFSASALPASTMRSQAVYSCLSHTLHPLDFNCFLFCASNLSYIPTNTLLCTVTSPRLYFTNKHVKPTGLMVHSKS